MNAFPQAPWILKLTHPDASQRPSASEVLESSLFQVCKSAVAMKSATSFNQSNMSSDAQTHSTSCIESLQIDKSFDIFHQTEIQQRDLRATFKDSVSSDVLSHTDNINICNVSRIENVEVCEFEQLLREKEIEFAKIKAENTEKLNEILLKDKKIASLTAENKSLHVLVAELQKKIAEMKT